MNLGDILDEASKKEEEARKSENRLSGRQFRSGPFWPSDGRPGRLRAAHARTGSSWCRPRRRRSSPTTSSRRARTRLAMLRAAIEWDARASRSPTGAQAAAASATRSIPPGISGSYIPTMSCSGSSAATSCPSSTSGRTSPSWRSWWSSSSWSGPAIPCKARPDIPGLRLHRCDGHLLAISSTELRDRARRGLSLDYFVPHKAIVYIRQHGLLSRFPGSP